MKGNFKKGLKVFKMSSKKLDILAESSFVNVENKKIPLKCELEIGLNKPIRISISTLTDKNSFYNDIHFDIISNIIPERAINNPITEDRIKSQIMKTTNTPYEFKDIIIHLENNIYIPHISDINKLRRDCLANLENIIEKKCCKKNIAFSKPVAFSENNNLDNNSKISILLNKLNLNEDYSLLKNIDRIYIPLRYFSNSVYEEILKVLAKNFELYIYLPVIMRNNYKNLLNSILEKALKTYNIKGFIISNLSNLEMLQNYSNTYDFIGNYTLNVFNNMTALELNKLNINTITLSPELNKNDFRNFTKSIPTELIVYGNIPIMNMNYCPLGKSNKCLKNCKHYCMDNSRFYLIDRLGFKFEIIPDSMQSTSIIFNSKTLSIIPSEHNSFLRLDFIHENIKEINYIVDSTKNGIKLEGSNFTNGNWFRDI